MSDNKHSKTHIPKAQGHKARKRFGQNFLHDSHVIDKIVRAINPKHSDALVEIGPGMGALNLVQYPVLVAGIAGLAILHRWKQRLSFPELRQGAILLHAPAHGSASHET